MIKLGILGCAEIAYRRFMPAVLKVEGIEVVAIGEEYAAEKLKAFCDEYSLKGYTSFEEMINNEDLDAVYIPQPPSLHYKWAKYALEHNLHVLVEKPSTINYHLSEELVEIAKRNNCALHENYMFQYHSQIEKIKELISNRVAGEIRLIRLDFGFPLRAKNDFRYVKDLGGGALLDAAGYTLKLASVLLGDTVKVKASQLNNIDGYEVDMYGSAMVSNDEGVVCQIGFGMDSFYQCNIQIWGSKGMITSNRIFTAPPEYEPRINIETNDEKSEIVLEADSHFVHSIEAFLDEINDSNKREKMYNDILLQARLVQQIKDEN